MLNSNFYIYQDGLESERLTTRFLTKEDSIRWQDFIQSEIATEFTPKMNHVTASEHSDFWIKRQLDRYLERHFGLQAILLKETGEFIGQCGLLRQEVNQQLELEVGYHFLPEFWGNGYAPEAARIFMQYAEQNKLSDSITSLIHVNNTRSQRVAEKNGLERESQFIRNDSNTYIYRKSFKV